MKLEETVEKITKYSNLCKERNLEYHTSEGIEIDPGTLTWAEYWLRCSLINERKTGHWVRQSSKIPNTLWKCSKCGRVIYSESEQDRNKFHQYCSQCGSRMEQNKEEKTMKNKTNLSSPWVSYYHKLCAFFRSDPNVEVKFDEENDKIELYVTGDDKYLALTAIMPDQISFGNVTIAIDIIPANKIRSKSKAELIKDALTGNGLYSNVLDIQVPGASNKFTYVMFEPKVVHYWDDNLGDPHGNVTTLAQDLAKDIFTNLDGVFYCTENYDPDL
jgi:DNA-directed RNA polymerase subunit RPC12/RpoP